MNYYEELGLKPDASPAEIRQAYRNLARLLHPDRHPDPELRRLAGGQMKRLNTIYETLSDPLRRRDYDTGLGQTLAVVRPAALRLAPKANIFSYRNTALVAVSIAGALAWWQLASDAEPSASTAATIVRSVPAKSTGSKPRVRDSAKRSTRQREWDKVPAQENGAAASAPTLEPPVVSMIESGPPALAHSVTPMPAAPEPVAASVSAPAIQNVPRFGGIWVYVRQRLPASKRSEYPAEFIEAVISEEGTQLNGRYRARYNIADRPISAEVAFQFVGKAEDSRAGLQWTGAGGAQGEVRLVLLSANSMQLDWIATSLGTQLGLASGTAVLTRLRER